MEEKFKVVYEDRVKGVLLYQKSEADELYRKGHRIRVYDQEVQTGELHPLCEWVPGSHNIVTF